jgi:hypothetical protein
MIIIMIVLLLFIMIIVFFCNAPTEALRRRHLLHPSDGPQLTSPTNKKDNKEIKRSQLINLSNRLFNDAGSL